MTRSVAAALLLVLAAGCQSDAAERTATRFVDRYIVELDREAAVALCIGPAREAVLAEMRRTDHLRPTAEERPHIFYRRIHRRDRPVGTELTYELAVAQGRAEIIRRLAVSVRPTDAGWRVFNFRFSEPPDDG